MTPEKLDYVICVNAPGPCWLGQPSDEDDPGALCASNDLDMAVRYTSFSEARRALRNAVKMYPERSFRLDVTPKANLGGRSEIGDGK